MKRSIIMNNKLNAINNHIDNNNNNNLIESNIFDTTTSIVSSIVDPVENVVLKLHDFEVDISFVSEIESIAQDSDSDQASDQDDIRPVKRDLCVLNSSQATESSHQQAFNLRESQYFTTYPRENLWPI